MKPDQPPRSGRRRTSTQGAVSDEVIVPGIVGPLPESRPERQLRRLAVGVSAVGPIVLAILPFVGFGAGQTVSWLAAFPLVASLVLTWRGTLTAGLYALTIGTWLWLDGPREVRGEVLKLVILALIATFAVVNSLQRERRERRLLEVSEVARVAQQAILRPLPSRSGSVSMAARYRSADPAAAVGGDLLEAVPTERGVRLIVGDVRGKGLAAVDLAASALASFRGVASRPNTPLTTVVEAVDQTVAEQIGEEDFVTAVFVDVDEDGWVEVVNCGHPPPLRLVRGDDTLRPLNPSTFAPPLGLDPVPRSETFTFGPGDRILLVTDGVLEARDENGAFLTLNALTAPMRAPSLNRAADRVVQHVLAHAGGALDDDMALLIAELHGHDEAKDRAPA